jgi:hypothetical protein
MTNQPGFFFSASFVPLFWNAWRNCRSCGRLWLQHPLRAELPPRFRGRKGHIPLMNKLILLQVIKQVLGAAGLSAALMTMVVYPSKSQPIPEFVGWALRPSLVPDFAQSPVEAGNSRDTRPQGPANAAHLRRRSSHGFCSVGPDNRRRGYARDHVSCKRFKTQQEGSTARAKKASIRVTKLSLPY